MQLSCPGCPVVELRGVEPRAFSHASDELVSDENPSKAVKRLLDTGTTGLGGARPKASARLEDGSLAIAKFPHSSDGWDVMAWEATTLDLLEEAGIRTSQHRLTHVGERSVLISRRFDRTGVSDRIGYISAMTATGSVDGEHRDYADIAEAMRDLSLSPRRDHHELYNRVIVGVALGNTDDHLRNHGFLADPLVAVQTRAKKDRRRNFFRELLPEGRMLTRMAQRAGLEEQDVIGLLRAHGRDTAGALQIWDPDVPGEPKEPDLETLSTAQVADMLTHVQDNPLGNKPVGGKTSLAGVQDKIVLASTQDGWGRVIDGYPSTHILRPESSTYPTIIYDEEFGARLARAVGLSSYRTWIEDFGATSAVVIERYDRSLNVLYGRIHQEDFGQALGAGGDQKYQKYGGRVSLSRIAKVLSATGNHDSLDQLLRSTVLSVAVGNLDMHAKNLSLLRHQDGSMALAPAYDVVPQTHLPNDGEVALAIDNQYRHQRITRAHLIAEARMWGHSAPERIVDETIATVLEVATNQNPHPSAYPHLAEDIIRFTENLAAGREVGSS